ncbi:hypothetical protein [Siminovitchia sp. 179-K 8D1 HS]|uniref:hypothetical protein n=1 Tax=Siminovitchia sp. 179-K 8D1 HS TaxID=3142385 RepID=UPI0039A09D1B
MTKKIKDKELKLKTICYFLNVILNNKHSLEERKKELLRVAAKLNGFPEFSDIWGTELRALDEVSLWELRILLNEYDESKILAEYQ